MCAWLSNSWLIEYMFLTKKQDNRQRGGWHGDGLNDRTRLQKQKKEEEMKQSSLKCDQLHVAKGKKPHPNTPMDIHTNAYRASTHRVSQEVLRVPYSWPGLHLHVIATFVVRGRWRLRQVRKLVSRPGASEADLVQALEHGQHRAPGLYLNMADGNPAGTKKKHSLYTTSFARELQVYFRLPLPFISIK